MLMLLGMGHDRKEQPKNKPTQIASGGLRGDGVSTTNAKTNEVTNLLTCGQVQNPPQTPSCDTVLRSHHLRKDGQSMHTFLGNSAKIGCSAESGLDTAEKKPSHILCHQPALL